MSQCEFKNCTSIVSQLRTTAVLCCCCIHRALALDLEAVGAHQSKKIISKLREIKTYETFVHYIITT